MILFCVVQFTENKVIFWNLAHLQGHEGNDSDVKKIAFIVFTTTQELQFTLKNVSSCPSHLTNLETLYIRYVSFQITCLFALCLGSFRFCRSVKTWVQVEGVGTNTRALWENHQSEINGNILFFPLCVCGQAEQDLLHFLQLLLLWWMVCVCERECVSETDAIVRRWVLTGQKCWVPQWGHNTKVSLVITCQICIF